MMFRASHLIIILAIISSSFTSYSQTEPVVKTATYFRATTPLRDMVKIPPGQRDRSWKDNIIRNEVREKDPVYVPDSWHDPLAQTEMGRGTMTTPIENFEGTGNVNSIMPPDTDGDVNADYFFQMINLSFTIFDKQGNIVDGPYDNSTLWDGFIGPWTGTNDGDPIVLYDEIADRWMVSQFAVNTSDGTYWELIAISATSDPTGVYYQYAFQFPDFNDYPKFGLWNDAYYASFNMFGSYFRVAAAAFERDSMLVGAPGARMVLFDLPNGSNPHSMLPADFDGTPPPAGTPNPFIYFNDYSSNDELRIWEFDVDWATPSNSTFAETQILYPTDFDSDLCAAERDKCIDQPGTTVRLESLADRLMYRLQYRNFGGYEAMVVNHTVDVGSGHAGIRWYEFRDTGSGWTIYQEGTYAPDSDHRWMGSIAMDGFGNIGLGYSVSSSTTYPSIRITGRQSSDPLGQMTVAETEIIAGGGSQTYSAARWGDYSHMAVDPSDDSTFWFTTEYMAMTAEWDWQTRIASFRIEPAPPIADFDADNTTAFENTIITFSDVSSGAPDTWSWTITPGNVTYVNGTTSSSQNPEVLFTDAGTYTVELTSSNPLGSDTEIKTDYISIIDNNPVTLPWMGDFESAGPTLTFTTSQDFLDGIPRWSYEKTATGRLRFQAGSGFAQSGSNAATFDSEVNGTNSINYLILTLNLLNYADSTILLDFYYMHHGEEVHDNDKVWARGSQTDSWIEVYDLLGSSPAAGVWNEITELDISTPVTSASQTITSTFQLRFGQEDNYIATGLTSTDGMTFDDIRVSLDNDVPEVEFSADKLTAGSNTVINFIDQSTNSPTAWNWNFPGAMPNSSADQNPSVEYSSPGYYDVTLTAQNTGGSTTLSKADYILIEDAIFTDDFETLTGWTLTNEFEIGPPQGKGAEHGNPDPLSAYGGNNVLGVDLSGTGSYQGDYEASLTNKQCQAVSPAFDCSGYTSVTLSFMRWLNVEQSTYDHAYIDVSDGSNWYTIWSNSTTNIEDASWSFYSYDISSYAAGNSGVQVRFSIGSTDGSWQFSGWNIDDLKVTGEDGSTPPHNVHWTGTDDNNWNNPNNWSSGAVPDNNTKVTIPSYIPGVNQPGSFSQPYNEIKELNIEPGSTFTIGDGDTLVIDNQ